MPLPSRGTPFIGVAVSFILRYFVPVSYYSDMRAARFCRPLCGARPAPATFLAFVVPFALGVISPLRFFRRIIVFIEFTRALILIRAVL